MAARFLHNAVLLAVDIWHCVTCCFRKEGSPTHFREGEANLWHCDIQCYAVHAILQMPPNDANFRQFTAPHKEFYFCKSTQMCQSLLKMKKQICLFLFFSVLFIDKLSIQYFKRAAKWLSYCRLNKATGYVMQIRGSDVGAWEIIYRRTADSNLVMFQRKHDSYAEVLAEWDWTQS